MTNDEFRRRIPSVHKAFERRAFYGSNDCSMHAWNCHYQLAPLFNYLNCNQTNGFTDIVSGRREFGESSCGDRRTTRSQNNLMAAGSTVYSRKVCFICLVNSLEMFRDFAFLVAPLKFVLAWLTNHKSEFWYLINVSTTLSFTQIACFALIISKGSPLISANDK